MKFRSLSLLFLVASLAAQHLAGQGPPTIRIGTWNLEFLGASGNYRNNLPPRDDQDFAKIGEKVKSLGVAVLAVQEICGSEPLQKVARGAGPSWKFVLGTTGAWDDGKTSQQVGFLWDSAVVECLFAEELLQLPREGDGLPIFHRVPVTAAFKVKATGADFRATTVHLKAGQKKDDETKRRLEATALREWFVTLQRTNGEDEDRVLLGDFNSTYGSEPETIFEKDHLLTYLQPHAPMPTIMHFADPIDQIVAGRGFRELNADSFLVRGDFGELTKEAWRKTYSDHYPVTAEVVVANDDDPNATFTRGGDKQSLPPKNRPAVAFPGAKGAAVAAQATSGGPATSGEKVAWPPTVGEEIVVHCVGEVRTTGRLALPLPEGPGGWVVIEQPDGVRGIPWSSVIFVTPAAK